MAKKIRNLLLLGAAVGAAAAGTYYYLQKKDAEYFDEDDDDADDFDIFEDEDDLTSSDSKSSRNYVPLHFDSSADTGKEEPSAEKETAVADTSSEQNVTLESMDSVEEFFDDDEEDEEIDNETPVDTE